MARSNGHKIELTAYDDLFQTDESRAEAKLSKIRDRFDRRLTSFQIIRSKFYWMRIWNSLLRASSEME